MSYTFLDASASVQTANSSVVSGVIQEPYVQISSVLRAIPVINTGASSISGTVNIGNVPSVNAFISNVPSVNALITNVPSVNSFITNVPSINAFITNVPSVNAVISGGSIVAVTGAVANQSVSGTVGASVIGLTPVFVSNPISSVAVAGNVTVTGTVGASVIGLTPVNVVGSVYGTMFVTGNPSISGQVGASIIGAVPVTFGTNANSSVYAVLSSITTVNIMASNANRKGGTIFNSAGTTVYVKLGATANTSVYSLLMQPNDYYELPFSYTGVVAGISNSNAGIINVTEITA